MLYIYIEIFQNFLVGAHQESVYKKIYVYIYIYIFFFMPK